VKVILGTPYPMRHNLVSQEDHDARLTRNTFFQRWKKFHIVWCISSNFQLSIMLV